VREKENEPGRRCDPLADIAGARLRTDPVMNTPPVTVVMAVRNEGRFIDLSVGSVLAQDYPVDRLEVIVADGMSEDGTRERIAALAAAHSNLILIDNPGRIVPTGLNAALRRARGDVIVRVDGHCEIAPDYVRACVRHLLAGEAEGVGGSIETIGETPAAAAIAAAMSSPFGVGGSAFRTVSDRTLYVDTVPFPAYTRAALESTGPFDEELVRNQDDEYNYRLRARGGRILLAQDVRSRYRSRASFRGLWRQYFQYGYWKVRVMQKHPRQMQPRQLVPPLFVLSLLALGLAAPFWSVALRGLVALALIYLTADAVASVRAAGGRWRLLPSIGLAMAILHLAYGTGFVVGLVRFAGRWGSRRASSPVMRTKGVERGS
jgi:glycosyltransferase involved in cell wall biosynthesis